MISQGKQETEFFGKLADIGSLFRLQSAIEWALRGLTAGLAVDAGLLLVSRYRAFNAALAILVGVPLVLLLAGVIVGSFQGQSHAVIAARTDRKLSLKERLTTALELQGDGATGVLAQAQISDALWHIRRIDPWRTFPPSVPRRESKAVLAAIVITAALIAVPNPGKAAIERQAAVAQAINQEAQRLAKTTTDIKQNEDQTGNHSQDQQTLDQILSELQKQLSQPSLSAEDALAKLQAAQDKLAANQDGNADQLAEALQALAASFDNQPLLQKVAQDINGGNYNQAAQDLNAAGQQALSGDQSARDSLAASLRAAAAAQAKAGNSQLGDSLGQASDSLNGSPAETSAAFRQASSSLQNAGQRSQAQQNLSQAASAVQQSSNSLAQATGQAPNGGAQSFTGSSTGANGSSDGSNGADGFDPSASQGQGPGDGTQGQGNGQPGQGQGQGNGPGDGTGSGGSGSETIYTADPNNPLGISGQQAATGQVATGDDNSLANPANNGANVPYQQVVGQYQQQASQAMDRAAVPLSYRQIVKDYFSSLAPRG